MKVFKIRTKVEVMLLFALMIIVGISSVFSVTQEFGVSPTGDTLVGVTSVAITPVTAFKSSR